MNESNTPTGSETLEIDSTGQAERDGYADLEEEQRSMPKVPKGTTIPPAIVDAGSNEGRLKAEHEDGQAPVKDGNT